MIERIKCYGEGIEIWYFPKDLTVKRWENFLENRSRGNETVIKFQEKDGRIITINPSQWGSVEVYRQNNGAQYVVTEEELREIRGGTE